MHLDFDYIPMSAFIRARLKVGAFWIVIVNLLDKPASCKTVYAFMMQMCWKSSASTAL